ncbi:MAG: hypothetical protein ACQEVA_22610 [Myxococcota bacterium]
MSTTLIIILGVAFLGGPVVIILLFVFLGSMASTRADATWDEDGNPLDQTALAEKYGLRPGGRSYGYRVRGELDDMVVDFSSHKRSRRRRKSLFPSRNEGSKLVVEFHLPMPPGLAFGLHKGPVEPPLHMLEDVLRPIDREYKGNLVMVAHDPDEAGDFLDDERILNWLGLLCALGNELDFRDHTLRWEATIKMEVHQADHILRHLTQARQAMREKFDAMSEEDARKLPAGHW